MCKIKAIVVFACAVFLHAGRAPADEFANPIDVLVADPQVLLENGTYYLYGTAGGGRFKVWTSDDLVNWQHWGAIRTTANSWGQERFWAPEVVKWQGKFYLFYSAAGPDNIMRICVASAISPMGPFTDIAAPLFDNGQAYIDAHVFVDTDGQPYLYCSQDMSYPPDSDSDIVVAKLNSTFTGLASQPTLCIRPDKAWEHTPNGNAWNEGASIIKHNGYYYMLYSGNVYSSPNYSIGYAYATNPLGPWTKYAGNPVVRRTASVSGPGHCTWTTSPDGQEYWMVYHTQQQLSGGGARQVAIDRFEFVDQASGPDVLVVPGAPSVSMQEAPSGTPAFPGGGSDEFSFKNVDRGKWIIFNENAGNHSFSGSACTISTVDGDLYGGSRANWQNIFLQYPPWDDFEVTVKLRFSPGENFEQATLFAWQDHNNHIRFSDVSINGDTVFEIGQDVEAVFSSQVVGHDLGADLWMRLTKIGNMYTCYSSGNGSVWAQRGLPVNLNLIDLKIGFGAASPISGRRLNAVFDYFRVEPAPSGIDEWSLY